MLHLVSQDTENIVKFISFSEDPLSIMIEYLNFSFLPFGQDKHVSALNELNDHFLCSHAKGWQYNHMQVQELYTVTCGQFVVFCIYQKG